MVMAQDPETAEHGAMPAYAIDTGLVDYVLPVEDMPAALIEYIGRSEAVILSSFAPDGDSPDLEPVLRTLADAGFEFRGYKRGTLARRVARRMSVNRVASLQLYCDLLRRRPEEVEALGLDMMIGVTEFFRDPQAGRRCPSGSWRAYWTNLQVTNRCASGSPPARRVRKPIRWRCCWPRKSRSAANCENS